MLFSIVKFIYRNTKYKMKHCIYIVVFSFLISCSVKYPEITGLYTFDYNHNSYMTLFVDNSYLIEGHITSYKYNSNYILVEQNPIDSICECNIECFRKMESYDKKSYKRCKEAFESTTYRQYWIIEKVQGDTLSSDIYSKYFEDIVKHTYGPFSKEEFLIKRKEFGVPEELRLDFEGY